ncbi:MAG TPA: adenylate/guanylate cyclase domain-containing protein, partial [Thermodesulfobacteriota bacterium]|nr:adenylate/guanylate cyclase domain-containing protein [Thermodesulfobacteriota bacterium]
GIAVAVLPFGLDLEENVGLDLLFRLRGIRQPPPDVLVVSTDRKSAEKLNLPIEPRKWPRSLHGVLIETLAKGGASVIVFDLNFDEPRPGDEDNRFAEALHQAGNVILCQYLKREKGGLTERGDPPPGIREIERMVLPIPELAKSAVALAPFPLPKVPVRVNQYWAFKTEAGDAPTLPVVAFQIHTLAVYEDFIHLLQKANPSGAGKLNGDPAPILARRGLENIIQEIRGVFETDSSLGKNMLRALQYSAAQPDGVERHRLLQTLVKMYASSKSQYLNYYGPAGTIRTVSYYQVLQAQDPAALDLRGKAVFIGMLERSIPDQKDGFHTVFSDASGLDLSGVEIAATAFANLLEDRPVRPLGWGAHLAAIALWGVLLGAACHLLTPIVAAATVAGCAAVFLWTASYCFNTAGLWLPLIVPLAVQAPLAVFGAIVWKSLEGSRERQKIRKSLRYYLPDRVVDQLGKGVQDFAAGKQVVYGTCLYTDAAQYTTLSETMHPEELGRFMNSYFEVLFRPIREHGGIILGTAGDSMLALWVTEEPDPAVQKKACHAALDIARGVDRFNESPGGRRLPTRIGLHSGEVLLGNVGAVDHYEYRAMGDIVNTASRIDGLNKQLGTRILVSDEVIRNVDGFVSREVGEFLMVGKTRSLVMRELVCRAEESSAQVEGQCRAFSQSLEAFRRGAWKEAMAEFEACDRLCGADGPSQFYSRLCKEYLEKPPGEPWNGVVCTEKK